MKSKQARSFSWSARGRSFGYAWQGVKTFFRTEHNAVLHLLGTLFVTGMAMLYPPTVAEGAALVLAAGFVWVAELFNTAIEKVMDYIQTERQPAIRYIKDLSAGAVLVAALTALLVALFIFIPKL